MAAIAEPTTSTLAVYMRVSSDEQREHGTIQTQRSAAERYLLVQDLTPYGWYADDGVSGTIPFTDRPEGARLLADAAAGHVRTVLVWRLDRMGRNALGVLKAVEALEQAGVRLVSITESFDTSTPAGRLQLNMLATIAQFERDSIVQRTNEGINRHLRDQRWMGGQVPYGYRVEGQKKDARLVIDSETADITRLIYRLYVDDGMSLQHIADHLNALGVPTAYMRQGRTFKLGTREHSVAGVWRPSRVRRMLINPVFKGEALYGLQGKTRADNPISVAVPALVSPETWEAAQRLLKSAQVRRGGHNAKYPYLLHGFVTCTRCGRVFTGVCIMSHIGGQPYPIHYYICNGKRCARALFKQGEHRLARCDSPTLNADWLDAAIWADVEHYIRNPDAALDALAMKLRGAGDQQDILREDVAKAQQRQQAKQREKDAVIALYRRGRISERDLDRQLDDIATEEAQLAETVERLKEQAQCARASEEQLAGAAALLERLRERLDSGPLTPALQREAIAGLVASVLVDRKEAGTSLNGRPKYRPIVTVTYHFSDPSQPDVAEYGAEYHAPTAGARSSSRLMAALVQRSRWPSASSRRS
jgi:site-specific DNA recombinase